MKLTSLAALSLAVSPVAAMADHHEAAPVEAHENAPVEVMVLGMYHLNNPGLDLINVEVDDVLSPHRQQELQAITDALAEWGPTRILVEAQPETEDLHMPSYRTRAAERVAEDRNEHFQIGYRLALQLGHEDVYGFDEHSADDEPDYFPMDSVQQYAAQHDMMAEFGSLMGYAQATIAGLSENHSECSIAANLLPFNDAAFQAEGHARIYYGLLQFGDADNQPGAELNAYWYMRNAKMFAKTGLIAEPGDRVLIIVGSGHKYWLDHFAANTPGYASVDPTPYLQAADDGRCH